ncbi:hypothetical protein TNCV_3055341 [Trichonephila clavipes]|nr:hypothetical protein TNCV_3055341 [Trichonephila clavipes]
MVSEQRSLRINVVYFLEIPKRRRIVSLAGSQEPSEPTTIASSHKGLISILESYGDVNDDGLTVMLPQNKIGDQDRQDPREFFVDNRTQVGRDGFLETFLDGIVPSLPGSAVNLTMIQHMGNSKTGAVDKVPIAKSCVIASLDEVARCRVQRDISNSFALVGKGRETRNIRCFELIPYNPDHELCSRGGDGNSVWVPMNVEDQ